MDLVDIDESWSGDGERFWVVDFDIGTEIIRDFESSSEDFRVEQV